MAEVSLISVLAISCMLTWLVVSYIEDCLTAERQHFPTDTISLLPSTTIGMNQVDPGSQYSGPANTAVPPQRHTRSILTSAGSQNMAPNHAPPRSLRGLLL